MGTGADGSTHPSRSGTISRLKLRRQAIWPAGTGRAGRRRSLLLVLLLPLALRGFIAGMGAVQGDHPSALYPDLQTLPPSELQFDTEVLADGQAHYLLRLTNTVWNAGPGRLEVVERERAIYQHVYDAAKGGTLVQRLYVGSDIIYHPGHNHYHFENFASYLLLQRDTNGVYQATTNEGTKTSFCIADFSLVEGSYELQYPYPATCDKKLQGMTVGWADPYPWWYAEQWVDLGLRRLADGEYAVESTADPGNKLVESTETNNVARTYFSVRNGAITNERATP